MSSAAREDLERYVSDAQAYSNGVIPKGSRRGAATSRGGRGLKVTGCVQSRR